MSPPPYPSPPSKSKGETVPRTGSTGDVRDSRSLFSFRIFYEVLETCDHPNGSPRFLGAEDTTGKSQRERLRLQKHFALLVRIRKGGWGHSPPRLLNDIHISDTLHWNNNLRSKESLLIHSKGNETQRLVVWVPLTCINVARRVNRTGEWLTSSLTYKRHPKYLRPAHTPPDTTSVGIW